MGKVFRFNKDVDTDQIIASQYLLFPTVEEMKVHAFESLDANFASEVRPGDFVVSDDNFGCGSSREHAPIAIKACGISCVIAETFARIFYRNALNIGLPILECPAAANAISAGDEVTVNLETGEIADHTTGQTFHAEPFPPFMMELIAAGGLAAYLKGTRK